MTEKAQDTPITLKEACALYGNKFTVSTLRAEYSRGRLEIFRLGKRDYTTVQSMQEMISKCREEVRRRASTLTESGGNGLSETARASSALAALSQTVTALKQGLPRISGQSIRRNAHRPH
jgi:hypothetical protein